MRKIIAFTQVTLDGIMQAPGGPEEDPSGRFIQGGWAMPFFDDPLADVVLGEIMSREFDLLLGRRTYEIFAAYWPYAPADNPVAKPFNRATKFVATRTLEKFDWKKTRSIGGDAVAELGRLKKSDGPELHLWGSGNLLQSLIAADLIDEFQLWVFPLILGTGKRLFENGVPPRGFRLMESRRAQNGVLFNTYHPTGAIQQGPSVLGEPSEAELVRRRKQAAEEAKTDQRR